MRAWWVLPAASLIVCAVFFCYYMTTEAGFAYDDPVLIHDEPLVSDPSANFMDCFFQPYFGADSGFYRPLMTLLFRIEYFQYKGSAFGFHLDNVIIQALACLALFVLLLVLGVPLPRALAAGLVLAIHPVTTECVAWISGRTDPLSFFFMGLSLIFLVAYFKAGAPRMRSGSGAAAVLFFLMAVLVKEAALALLLPAGILIRMYTRGSAVNPPDSDRTNLDSPNLVSLELDSMDRDASRVDPSASMGGSRGLYLFGAMLCIGVFFFVIGRVLQGRSEIDFYYGKGDAFERGLTFLSLVPDYMGKLFVPLKQQLARPTHVVTTLANLKVWVGAFILLAALVAMLVGIRKRSPALALGSGLFLVSLLAVSNVFPIPYGLWEMEFPFFERYAYIPLAGLLMALAPLGACCSIAQFGGSGAGRRGSRRKWTTTKWRLIRNVLPLGIVLCLSPFLIEKTRLRNQDWVDDVSLFTVGVRDYPESPTMSFNLGQALMGAGKFRGAKAAYYQAALLDPDLVMARVQGAVATASMGRIDEAVAALEAVLAEDPKNGQALDALGFIYAGDERWIEAFESYSRALPLLADNPVTRQCRDRAARKVKERMEDLFLEKKQFKRVLEMTDRVLAWLPSCAWALEARGLALLKLGYEEKAIRSLERALVYAGAPPMRAMEKLIPLYMKRGRKEEANQLQEQLDMINKMIAETEQKKKSEAKDQKENQSRKENKQALQKE